MGLLVGWVVGFGGGMMGWMVMKIVSLMEGLVVGWV